MEYILKSLLKQSIDLSMEQKQFFSGVTFFVVHSQEYFIANLLGNIITY